MMNRMVRVVVLAMMSILACSACSYQRKVLLQPTDLPEYIYKTPMENDYMSATVGIFAFREPPYAAGAGEVAAELLYDEVLTRKIFAVVHFEPYVSGMTVEKIKDLAKAKGYDLMIIGDLVYYFEGSDHYAARVDERMRVIDIHADRTLWYAKAVDVGPNAPTLDFAVVEGHGAPAPSMRTLFKRNAEKFARLLVAMPSQKLWTKAPSDDAGDTSWDRGKENPPVETRQFLGIPFEDRMDSVRDASDQGPQGVVFQGKDSSSRKKEEKQQPTAPPERAPEKKEAPLVKAPKDVDFKPVYFRLDQSALLPRGRETLKEIAAWMKANPKASLQIQGHCDERGTYAYNIALGAQRAWSAKKYLVNQGVAAGRMTTVSFGKERPVDHAHTEKAWAKNRRAEFVVQK